jgi:DNA repair protein RadC
MCTYIKTLRNKVDKIIIDRAKTILENKMVTYNAPFQSADLVADYLKLHMAQYKDEVFTVLFLNHHLQLIAAKDLFFGSITCNKVHYRVIARHAIELNASAIIISHNHPGCRPDPSDEDHVTTQHVVNAMSYFDVDVLDHIIIGGMDYYSFADNDQMPMVTV